MANLTGIKRIIAEDFEAEYQNLINKLAFSLNPFLEQTVDAFEGNIDFSNINQEVKSFEVTVDANGTPSADLKMTHSLNSTSPQGMICIRAINLTTSTNYVDSTPFISYTSSAGVISVQNIKGLTANNKYRLTVILVG